MNDLNNEYDTVKDRVRQLLDKQTDSGHHTFRKIKDLAAKQGIAIGGISVILAVVMIFFYLLYVVFPIFKSAEIVEQKTYPVAVESSVLWGMEEYGEIGFQLKADGIFSYFDAATGENLSTHPLALEPGETVTAARFANHEENLVILGLSSGRILLIKQAFRLSYPEGVRKITPDIEYPFGQEGYELHDGPISNISATSQSAYIENDTNELLSFLILNEGDEVLQIKFKNKIYSLNKIILKMKISKLGLANNTLCK